MGDPHIPQNFSSACRGLLQVLQSFGMTGLKGTCGGKFDCRDRGDGDVFPGMDNGSGAASVKGGIA
jgi:hypothetical protein